MDITKVWENLALPEGGTIVYVVLDGVGGLPDPKRGGTELQVAQTPRLDQLAAESACGLLEIVGPGITPGSGPGHLALFGYDPLQYNPGRGVLSALGIDFELKEGDVAARVNFATVDNNGRVTDRRAGRIDTKTNERLCKQIREKVKLDVDFFFQTVSEHRAVFVLRQDGLGGHVADTDPQKTGVPPADPEALSEDSQKTAQVIQSFLEQTRKILSDEKKANMILLRGFEKYSPFPSLKERFGLTGICIAEYPMYRGVSRLIGLDIAEVPKGLEESFRTLEDLFGDDHDFYFLHVKKTDSTGEDADFDRKVEVIEAVDHLMPMAANLMPDVLVVTADHSTPAQMGGHSWHPVPVMLRSRMARVDPVGSFDEFACSQGSLGIRAGTHIMGMALAHAGRLKKYGA